MLLERDGESRLAKAGAFTLQSLEQTVTPLLSEPPPPATTVAAATP